MHAKEVYWLVRKIPKGSVSTYREIAKALGKPNASRAVGVILTKNPELVKTPCHRVVHADGRVGGYAKGAQEKIRLLAKEGVLVADGKIKDFEKKLFKLNELKLPALK